jgi:lipoteichoic acid synthase
LKKYQTLFYYLFAFFYWEFLFKIIAFKSIFNESLLNILLFGLFWSLLCFILTNIFNEKINRKLFYTIILFFSIWFSAQICVFRLFGFFFSLNLSSATGQIFSFFSTIVSIVYKNIWFILLFFIPYILINIFRKKIKLNKITKKDLLTSLKLDLISLGIFLLSLLLFNNNYYSEYNLFFNLNNTALSIEKLGVIDAGHLDLIKYFTNFKEVIYDDSTINIETNIGCNKPEEEIKYNNLNIDFTKNTSNDTINAMNLYFSSEKGTQQNEYTGKYKNKNLILFMAESFNEIAISKELTPTLYKLVHDGFYFKNFYTPTIDSTIGGEFQELTGLYAANGFLTNWKSGNNYFPFGESTLFTNAGYNTYAYHDHYYKFQNRNSYLKALGFTNFEACGNGLETKINCNVWPESDVEMINATTNDYITSDKPFMVFYATVSGHGDYDWTAQSSKHKDEVNNLNYSSKVLAYIAANIELNNALETLINKLSDAGKLDDTVIALVGDHYPYFLNVDEVNEASSYQKDAIIEINHSNFILWNNKMESKEIDKVGSEIDVIPTIYNLFGLPYDSRLIIGKDILSTEPGLAMFADRSWVSDYGSYFASTGKFIPKDNITIPDNYVSKMNNIVSNKINMSGLIIKNDYYRKVLGE